MYKFIACLLLLSSSALAQQAQPEQKITLECESYVKVLQASSAQNLFDRDQARALMAQYQAKIADLEKQLAEAKVPK